MPLPKKRRRRARSSLLGLDRRGADVGSSTGRAEQGFIHRHADVVSSIRRAEQDFSPTRYCSSDEFHDYSSSCSDASLYRFLLETKERPAYESRYLSLLARLRLAELRAKSGDRLDWENDGSDVPSGEIIETLAGASFESDDMRAAVVELRVCKYLRETLERDSEEFNSGNVANDLGDNISEDEYSSAVKELVARQTPVVDDWPKLDDEANCELHPQLALYRIKACLLLQGKLIDKLDDAALRSKYPRQIILDNSYFEHFEEDGTFGWYFDSRLCQYANFNNYQRLVLHPALRGGYSSWDIYCSFYNTYEIDREYLEYCETISKKIKWIEDYVSADQRNDEWRKIEPRGRYQAMKIAVAFPNISLDLARLGYSEYVSRLHMLVLFVKELDGVYFEIWKQVTGQEASFKDALKKVYERNMFPSRQHKIKHALEHDYHCSWMERQFQICTAGITAQVPENRVRELISKELANTLPLPGVYEQYARKKIKIAEYIGLPLTNS